MSKVYKGYELMKMFAEKQIKNGTKFKDLTDNNYADNSNIYRYENNNFIGRYGGLNILMLLKHDFELIEDEIDINSIEKFEIDKNNFIQTELGAFKTRKMDIAFLDKINELVQAVKQNHKEIKELKEK